MSQVFGESYSSAYDLLYQDKDYEAEIDLLERVFTEFGSGPVHSVLDLGCGTGNHAVPLATRGYAVTGVDLSPAMLSGARRKMEAATGQGRKLALELRQGDARSVRLDQKFDVALLMFAVLGYMLDNQDVLAALTTARRHVQTGGLLILDVWYGPAVLTLRPSDRLKVIPAGEERVLRAASGELDVNRNLCTVRYDLWRLRGDRLVSETHEDHRMRYFFHPELEFFMEQAGFQLARLGVFPDYECDPSDQSWNVLAVGRAI